MLVIRLTALTRTPSLSKPRSSEPLLAAARTARPPPLEDALPPGPPPGLEVRRTKGEEWVPFLQKISNLFLDSRGLVFADGGAEHVPQEVLEVKPRLLLQRRQN